MLVNGLYLPSLLLELIEAGKWKLSEEADVEKLEIFFNAHVFLDEFILYDLAEIIKMTNKIHEEGLAYEPVIKPNRYHANRYPSIIDFDYKKVLIIGDYYEGDVPEEERRLVCPLGLYYHENEEHPIVIHLPDDPLDDRWEQLSENFNTFVNGIGILHT